MTKTIVVIGATGHFGGRICRRIANEANTELIVVSRRLARAKNLAAELRIVSPAATLSAAQLDQTSPTFATDLERLKPDIVIHTAGPYQGQDYRVALACIECGSHYIDLADGREFVQNFSNLHEEAAARGVLLVSGASTLPGLSSAVIDCFRDRFESLRKIEMSIAPAHQTPRGHGTIAAVLSYCGKPFDVLQGGSRVTVHGWQDMKRQRYPALGMRLSAACDVPDLALLPDYVVDSETVTFHAALEAKWEQLALWLMAWVTRSGLIRDWTAFIPSFNWLSQRMIGLGSDCGGMHIGLTGVGHDQQPRSLSWFLTARQNHGPEIPCSPALVIARKLVADRLAIRGAFPCLGIMTLDEFDDEVRYLDIDWTIDESVQQ